MKLDYGTLLSPCCIPLSVGTIKKPTLKDVGEITFDRFAFYQTLLKLTPEMYYTVLKKQGGGEEIWAALPEEEKDAKRVYDIIKKDEGVAAGYTETFNFFFMEEVVYREGFFVLLKKSLGADDEIKKDDIRGVITENNLPTVLGILQQVCRIDDPEEEENPKFKNDIAKKLYEKMAKARKERNKNKKHDINLRLPNIISAVSNYHPTINPINVWDMTVFQLLDAFDRLRVNSVFNIDSTRVSVWGDERKTFDSALWYKNEYDRR